MIIIPGLPGSPSLALDSDLPHGQQRILIAIAWAGSECTLRRLMAMLGIKSTNGVHCHLKALRKKGWVAWEPLKSRTLRLTRELRWREVE